ncbi:MAG: hypothetical protein ACLS45_05375 [Subdoligranulum sp.]
MKIGGKLLERKTGGRSRYWQVFWLCFAVAVALFLPHCIIDGLNGDFFHYAGDFNDQQISFYSYANNFVKQGGQFQLGNGPGQRVCELLQLLSVRQPVFLAHPAAALSVDALGHGANALP